MTDHINERDTGSKQQCNASEHETKSGRPSNIALDTLQQYNIINNNNTLLTVPQKHYSLHSKVELRSTCNLGEFHMHSHTQVPVRKPTVS